MGITIAELKKEILNEIDELSYEKIKEVLDFVCFIKAKDAIDPSQTYFWTKQWQYMEVIKHVYPTNGIASKSGTPLYYC
ncbi:MAG: DUF2281 domain-containing protein [Candidatus Brocadia sinica]|nr:DUF2281 domain-containing protein [Candidatus Brocadia sinica]